MKVYIAGPLGFAETTKGFHQNVVIPHLEARGLTYYDPWTQPVEHYDCGLSDALALDDMFQRHLHLQKIWRLVGKVNQQEIDDCDIMLACLDGPDVDSGTAAEIGYAAAKGKRVIAWRSDLRLSGEEGMRCNLQVQYFVEMHKGVVCDSFAGALQQIDHLLHELRSKSRS